MEQKEHQYQKNPLWSYPDYPHYTSQDWMLYDSQRLPPLQ
jgi:hypothetical protein